MQRSGQREETETLIASALLNGPRNHQWGLCIRRNVASLCYINFWGTLRAAYVYDVCGRMQGILCTDQAGFRWPDVQQFGLRVRAQDNNFWVQY